MVKYGLISFVLLLCSPALYAMDKFTYSLNAGGASSQVKVLLNGGDNAPASTSDWDAALLLGASVHGVYAEDHHLGLAFQFTQADGDNLYSFRPLDYKYQVVDDIYIKSFFGVARYDQATPAHGYILGLGLEWLFLSDVSFSTEFAYGDKVARDRVLASDPPSLQPSSPEIFYDIYIGSLYLSWYF